MKVFSQNFKAIAQPQAEFHLLKVMGNVLNIEYYFWWRDDCFWYINQPRCSVSLHGQYQW